MRTATPNVVRAADVVVVCLSKSFNQAGYRQKEVRIALDEAEMRPEGVIFVVPARLEECDNLERCAAARGATTITTCVLPIATGTIRWISYYLIGFRCSRSP